MKKITSLLLSALLAGCQTSSTQTNRPAPPALSSAPFKMLSGATHPTTVSQKDAVASLQESAWDNVTRSVGTNHQITVTHANFTNAQRVYVIGTFVLPDTGILLMSNGSSMTQISNAVARFYGTNRMWYTLPADTNRHAVSVK